MSKELAFIDSRVLAYEALVAAMATDTEIYLIDQNSDGIGQIVTVLTGRSGIAAIHIVSHGNSGALYLGSAVLEGSTLGNYANQLGAIGQSLSAGGDILLYGCNVAAGPEGREFVERLASYSGADIAASTSVTGAASLGGDWQLERSTGRIEALAMEPANYPLVLLTESEPNGSALTANAITLNGAVIGSLSTSTDLDVYSVAVASAGTLTLTFDVPTNNTYSDYFELGLYGSTGTLL